MNLYLRISLIIALFIYFLVIYFLLKHKTLLLKYTLIWIFSGISMFIFILFPGVMIFITQILGIVEVPNALFAICLFFLLLITISITAILSAMNNKNKKLVQECAILEMRIRQLEKELNNYSKEDNTYENISNYTSL